METNLNNLMDSIFPNVDLSNYDINTSEDKLLSLEDDNSSQQQGQDKNKKSQPTKDDIKIISRADTSQSSSTSSSPVDLSKYDISTSVKSTPIIPSSSSLNLKIPPSISSITSKSQSGGKVRAGIGWRINPITKQSQFHTGIDIPATYGNVVNPAADGEVIFAGRGKNSGLEVKIKHDNGLITKYFHLSKINVEVGDKVKSIADIGRIGSTGRSTGPHLHFEVEDINGNLLNPYDVLASNPKVDGINLKLKPDYTAITGTGDTGANELINPSYNLNEGVTDKGERVNESQDGSANGIDLSKYDIKTIDEKGNEIVDSTSNSTNSTSNQSNENEDIYANLDLKSIAKDAITSTTSQNKSATIPPPIPIEIDNGDDSSNLETRASAGASESLSPTIPDSVKTKLKEAILNKGIDVKSALNSIRSDIHYSPYRYLKPITLEIPHNRETGLSSYEITRAYLRHYLGDKKGEQVYSQFQSDFNGTPIANYFGNPVIDYPRELFYVKDSGISGIDNQFATDEKGLGTGGYFKIPLRVTEATGRLINAYVTNGKKGAIDELGKIEFEDKLYLNQIADARKELSQWEDKHRWLGALRSGWYKSISATARTLNNIKQLGNAAYNANIYGYDSNEYKSAAQIGWKQSENLTSYEGNANLGTFQPKSASERFLVGVGETPMTIGRLELSSIIASPMGMSIMGYLDNIHRGEWEAGKAAWSNAIFSGMMRGGSKFFNPETQTLVDLAAISPLTRQVMLRGTNVIGGVGSQLMTNLIPLKDYNSDVIGNLADAGIMALFIPIGKRKSTLDIFNKTEPTTNSTFEAYIREQQAESIKKGYSNYTNIGTPLTVEGKIKDTDNLKGQYSTFAQSKNLLESPFSKSTRLSNELSNLKSIPFLKRTPEQNLRISDLTNELSNRTKIEQNVASRQIPLAGDNPSTNVTLGINPDANDSTSKGVVQLDYHTAGLNLINLERLRSDDSEFNKLNSAQQTSVNEAIEILQSNIPEEVQQFFRVNEDSLKQIFRMGMDSNEGKIRLDDLRSQMQEVEKDKGREGKNGNDNTTDNNNNIANGTKGVETTETTKEKENLDFKFTPSTERLKNISLFANWGKDNKYISQSKARESIDRVKNSILNPPSSSTLSSDVFGLGWLAKNSADLITYSAFHVEAGIRSLSEFINKLRGDFGEDFVNKLGNKVVSKWFEDGLNYYNSNNADPFFSGLKQEVLEKLPNKATKEQILNILRQDKFKNEFEWTTGLKEFIDKVEEGKKVNKDDLINIINNGQVKIKEKLLGGQKDFLSFDEWFYKNKHEYPDVNFNNEGLYPDYVYADYQLEKNQHFHNQPEGTRWGLNDYTGEKLETKGGENYKELLLISLAPIKPTRKAYLFGYANASLNESGWAWRGFNGRDISKYPTREEALANPPEGYIYLNEDYTRNVELNSKYANYAEPYNSNHWNEQNVVAHVRFNERMIDGKKVLFVEEIQSDWNQEGRKSGYKPNDFNQILFDKLYDKEQANLNGKGEPLTLEEKTKLDEWNKHDVINAVPQNPFMSSNWKELSIKRILRYAAENNFDKVAWTTSEMQQRRYNKLAEGKSIEWTENPDGTFNISLHQINGEEFDNRDVTHNLSLEQIARLTNEEVSKNIKNQVEQNKNLKDFSIQDKNTKEILFSSDSLSATYEYVQDNESVGKINVIDNRHNKSNGIINLSDTIKIGSGYGDYDKGYPIIFNKIGKRFGSRVGESEIEVGSPNSQIAYPNERLALERFREGAKLYFWGKNAERIPITSEEQLLNTGSIPHELKSKKELVPSIEITPSMRQSLTKEGQSIYNTSGLSPLPIRPENYGIRNRIVTKEDYLASYVNLRSEISKLPTDENNAIFNSGISPDSFITLASHIYSSTKDFISFSRQLIKKFGEVIQPHLEKLFNAVKRFNEDERGFLNFNKREDVSEENLTEDKNKEVESIPIRKQSLRNLMSRIYNPNSNDLDYINLFQTPLSDITRTGVFEKIGGSLYGKLLNDAMRNTQIVSETLIHAWSKELHKITDLVKFGNNSTSNFDTLNSFRGKGKTTIFSNFINLIEMEDDNPNRKSANPQIQSALESYDNLTSSMRNYINQSREALGDENYKSYNISERGYYRNLFLGNIRIFQDGKLLDTVETYPDAIRVIEQLDKSNPDGVVTLKANNRFAYDPMMKVTRRTLQSLLGKIENAEGTITITKKEVLEDFNNPNKSSGYRNVQGKAKYLSSLLKKESLDDFSKDFTNIMQMTIRHIVMHEELTHLSREIKPIINLWESPMITKTFIDASGKLNEAGTPNPDYRPRLAEYVKDRLNLIKGVPLKYELLFGNLIRKFPFISDKLANPDMAFRAIANKITRYNSQWKLAFSPRAALINKFDILSTLWPYASTSEMIDVAKIYSSKSERERVKQSGVFTSGEFKLNTSDNSASPNSEVEGAKSYQIFAKASEGNRMLGYIFGELRAKAQGEKDIDAIHRSGLEWAKKVEFDNSIWNSPYKLSTPIGKLLGQFKGYSIKAIENIMGAMKKQQGDVIYGKNGSFWSEFNRSKFSRGLKLFGGKAALGGVKSVTSPMSYLVGALGYSIFSTIASSFKSAGYSDKDSQKYAEFFYYGIPSQIGIDLSGSLAFIDSPYGSTDYEQVANFLLGPSFATTHEIGQNAKSVLSGDETFGEGASKTLDRFTPYAKNISAGVDLTSRGIVAATGDKEYKTSLSKLRFDNMELRKRLSNWDLVKKLLGFQDLRQTEYYDLKDSNQIPPEVKGSEQIERDEDKMDRKEKGMKGKVKLKL